MVSEQFYVDDILISADSESEAKKHFDVLLKTFASGHFLLKKWATNSKKVGEYMVKNMPWPDAVFSYESETFKTLGVLWNQKLDSLGVNSR